MTPATLSLLFSTMVLLSAVPGPVDAFVVARAASRGVLQAFLVALGIILADAIFLAAAIFGLTTLAEQAAGLFLVFKLAGAAYLVFLGFACFRVAPSVAGSSSIRASASSFLAGFLMTFGDPKAILFYFSMLPAFVDLGTITMVSALLVLLTASTAILLVKLAYGLMAASIGQRFLSDKRYHILNRITGIVLVGLGLFSIFQVLRP